MKLLGDSHHIKMVFKGLELGGAVYLLEGIVQCDWFCVF